MIHTFKTQPICSNLDTMIIKVKRNPLWTIINTNPWTIFDITQNRALRKRKLLCFKSHFTIYIYYLFCLYKITSQMGFSLMRNQKIMPTIKHLLIISIAINAGLLLKLLHHEHEWAGLPGPDTNRNNEVSLVKDVLRKAKPATDQYINLDQ